MANQPTKYSKFLVGAASAALVASAVAPVASAADFKDTKGNTHEEAINALSDAGIIKGYTDGSFQPNKTLTRSDVVKMMGKWLVTEGASIPEDARTNPRFSDLTTKSNGELLDYAAVVKDAGVFIGSNGKLLAGDNITRENMALVLVRAFDTVNEIDLVTYVNGQDFKADVKDLKSAKAEAQGAINVLDFYDITNPAVANFNPKGSTTRGHFATFLHKSINADFSDVTGEVTGTAAVKAINATTVEVSFKEDVKDVNSIKFSIDGLAISNAAVKQTDSKVVVLTTAVQTGDKEYTLKSGETTLGSFKGISGVIPTKITMNTTSTQGVVGKEVTLKADIGVKEAGVPVTFNVTAGSKLNKDHIEEVLTNAEGIATYSYTQYVSGEKDEVVAYPTGAPAHRDLATVYWGVDTILAITADDKKGNEINNGENKVYKAVYKDPKTGKVVANQKLHVTFAENVETTINKISNATVNGNTPYQLTNGKTVAATITTNSNGEATFTVAGTNTKVTPIVFVDNSESNFDNNRRVATGNDRLETTELQAKAEQLTIGAIQSSYTIDVTRDGQEEAAVGLKNGREYKVVVKTKDGKSAANEWVNVSFDEILDRNMNTNTKAYFVDKDDKVVDASYKKTSLEGYDTKGQKIAVKLDSKGEGTFRIANDDTKGYATPVVWIDINSSNAKEGQLDEGEPNKVAPISYFAEEKLTGGTVKATNKKAADKNKKVEEFDGDQTATFEFFAANQSGKEMKLENGYDRIDATFTVFNTGDHDIVVNHGKNGKTTISSKRSESFTVNEKDLLVPFIEVESVKDESTSVTVEARGTAIANSDRNNRLNNINLGSHEVKVKFISTKSVDGLHTGIVEWINLTDKEIKFYNKDKMKYKDASFKNANGVSIGRSEFETLVKANEGKAKVTVKKVKDGDKETLSFEIVSLDGDLTSTLSAVNAATTVAAVQSALEKSELTPAFKDLNADQKLLVATEVFNKGQLETNGFTESGLKNTYAKAYEAKAVTPALADVTAGATATTLGKVPGLDLTAHRVLTGTNLTTVNNALTGKTYATVTALQTALNNAIAGLSSSATVDELNAADTNEKALAAVKALGLDSKTFTDLGMRPQALVLDALVKKTNFVDKTDVERAINAGIVEFETNTTATIDNIEFTTGVTEDKLVITFGEDIELTDNVKAVVDSIVLVNGKLGSTPAGVYTSADNELTITLGKDNSLVTGSLLKVINVSDKFGYKVDLAAKKAGVSVHDLAVKVVNAPTPTAPAAPTGLVATDETTPGASDGKISGVTDLMEYKLSTGTTYTSVVSGDTELTGLAAGTYNVRVKAVSSTNTPAGTDAVVTIN